MRYSKVADIKLKDGLPGMGVDGKGVDMTTP